MRYFFRVTILLALIASGKTVAGGALQLSMVGGVYAEVYAQHLLYPFYRQSGISVRQSAGVSAEASDVVELGLHDAQARCEEGALMYLPASLLAKLSRRIEDFIPNALQPCAIGQLVWSTVVAFNADINTPRHQPALMDDFFNTNDFPGTRILQKSPRVLVEWALASSGIPADRIYEVLEDDAAWDLIEKQLRHIESDVVWVENDEDAFRQLYAGGGAFAAVSSSSVMKQALSGNAPQVIWDSALFEMSLLAIPSTAEKPELSSKFIRHVVTQGNLPAVSADLGLGTTRFSSIGLYNSAYTDYLPNHRRNNTNTIWLNASWWRSKSADKIIARFLDWVDRVETLQPLTLAESINLTAKAN